jgi:hypothetical protein
MADTILCPNCATEIPLADVIQRQVDAALRAESDPSERRTVA